MNSILYKQLTKELKEADRIGYDRAKRNGLGSLVSTVFIRVRV